MGLLATLLPWTAHQEMPEALVAAWPAAAFLALGALAGIAGALTARLRTGWAALAVFTAVGICAAAWGAGILDCEKSGRRFASEMDRIAGEEEVHFYEKARPSVHFYSGRINPALPDPESLAGLLSGEGRVLVVMDAGQLQEVARLSPITQVLHEDRIGERTLLLVRMAGSAPAAGPDADGRIPVGPEGPDDR
jgi:hypothetical protein